MRRLVVVVAACATRAPGDFFAKMPGTHVVFPCVDLAIAQVHDARARDPVIGYAFCNRCEHRVVIDFTAVRVVARDGYGREVALAPHDPQHEIRPLPLPGGFSGAERIEYDAPDSERIEVAHVCVDVGRLARDGDGAARWTCFDGATR